VRTRHLYMMALKLAVFSMLLPGFAVGVAEPTPKGIREGIRVSRADENPVGGPMKSKEYSNPRHKGRSYKSMAPPKFAHLYPSLQASSARGTDVTAGLLNPDQEIQVNKHEQDGGDYAKNLADNDAKNLAGDSNVTNMIIFKPDPEIHFNESKQGSLMQMKSPVADLPVQLQELPDLPPDKLTLGFKKLDQLDMPLGHISEKGDVDPSVQGLPEGSAQYAFAYPLAGSEISDGAFEYYGKDQKVVGILAVSDQKGVELTFLKKKDGPRSELQSDKDCPQGSEGYHSITLFKNAQEFCWMPKCKSVGDETMGCFMYKMVGDNYRVYLTSSALQPALGSIMILLTMMVAALQ